MKCLQCGNEDPLYFYHDQENIYCRRCIGFGRVDIGKKPKMNSYQRRMCNCDYQLQYPLTKKQGIISKQILVKLQQHQDVLVYAACGAGKTELTMEAIKYYLNLGKKVGFAISRRQVVLEIRERMQMAFKTLHVIAVCEGYTDVIDADLIICTMHQLHRYYATFDLLIMDEVDAFPYRDNAVLEQIALHACIGEKLMLTATPDASMLEQVALGKIAMVELFQRPHGYPLIVPEVRCAGPKRQLWILYRILKQQQLAHTQTLVFVPTIQMAKSLARLLKPLFPCTAFTSKTIDKEKCIAAFHQKKYECLISTTILERGITIRGIYVVIVHADHIVFNEASLIQMIGRVGRNIEMPTGKGWFLCTKQTNDIKRCVQAIEKMNTV